VSWSLPQQAFALHARFPAAKVRLTPKLLDCRCEIQPTAASRTYTVRIRYDRRRYPTTRVIVPKLESRPGESLPHIFKGGWLCLHLEEDWDQDMLLADTTLPWTSEWLIHYEIWKFTGEWYGGGEWPPRRTADQTTANRVMMSASTAALPGAEIGERHGTRRACSALCLSPNLPTWGPCSRPAAARNTSASATSTN
jgi:hypothetical protein